MVRSAHGDLLTAEKAAALATALGAPEPFPHGELHLLAENLLHYDEHTWGWWRSVEDPHSLESRSLGHRKVQYAEDAAMEGRRYRERAIRALATRVAPAAPEAERVIVFNPLATARREVVRHCAIWRRAAWAGGTVQAPTAVRVRDAHGVEIPTGCEWTITPATWCRISTCGSSSRRKCLRWAMPSTPSSRRTSRWRIRSRQEDLVIENSFYRVEVGNEKWHHHQPRG